jgi:hypothetical protein
MGLLSVTSGSSETLVTFVSKVSIVPSSDEGNDDDTLYHNYRKSNMDCSEIEPGLLRPLST